MSRNSPTVAIIGVGFVGKQLVEAFSVHYSVIAFDVCRERLDYLKTELVYLDRVILTDDTSLLGTATHYIVSVPTTLKADRSLDTSYIEAAVATLTQVARPGSVIVIESSVAVGMTRRLLKDLCETRGVLGGMSPERVDPGRAFPALEAVPKIISGLTTSALEEIDSLYSKVFNRIIKVSSPEVAEMTKLYENCQRMVNIAYANEMADAAYSLGLDPYEIANAAATKPFGYTPYSPSLGVGGHCIPCNPYYLLSNLSFPILEFASERMWARPENTARDLLKTKSTSMEEISKKRVLVVGAGYKPGQSLVTNSPSLMFAREVKALGAQVQYVDPLVKQHIVPDIFRMDNSTNWNVKTIEEDFDMVVIGIKQTGLDWNVLKEVEMRGKTQVVWRVEKPY